MAYASASDLIARFDTQIVGDLITDDDPTTELRDRPGQAEILASDVVAAMLDDASGRVEVAMNSGGRYTPAQLAALTGHGLAHLKRIVCAIAIALLFERRPERVNQEIAERYREQSDKYILSLQKGENLFGLADQTDVSASLISTAGPTAIDLQTRNLLDERMHRHLPPGASRLPIGR